MSSVSQHAFSEKVALVAGADTAVGRAVALQLALYGAYVIVCSESDDENHVTEELKQMGTLVSSVEMPEVSMKAAEAVAAHVGEQFGRIDLLVNCSPIIGTEDFERSESDALNKYFEKSVNSAYLLTKACLPLSAERPKFRVVNTFYSGEDGEFASRSVGNAAFGLVRELNSSTSGNVFVNGVAFRKGKLDSSESLDPDLFPAKRQDNSDDIARVVLYLLSGEAKSVAGEVINAS